MSNIYTQLFDELAHNSVASLITAEPAGLRGDPHFWQAFKSLATTIAIPETVEELEKLLLEMFKELTGEYPEKGKNIFVEAFSHGGMSSGHVSSDTWLERGLPLILEAFKDKN
jgi:molybdenum cofactor cytidylyltransferase